MAYEQFCTQVIELVGGKDNIQSVAHCMTRLRFKLVDPDKAKSGEIKDLDGVVDVVSNPVAYQIIIGTQVTEICAEMQEMLGGQISDASVEGSEDKGSLIGRAFTILSESMSPVIVPIMAAGLLAGILSLISICGLVAVDSSTYQIFESIRLSVFYFLPVLIAMSFAKQLDVNPFLAVTIAATLLSTSINGVEGLDLFGCALPAITYSNSFFPIILAIIAMRYIGKLLDHLVPKALQYFFNPVLLLVITLPITLVFFGPLGTMLSDALNGVFQFIITNVGSWAAVMVYAACQPFLITLGAGNFIIPIYMNFYATQGFDPVFTAAWIISDIAVCGAVLGYFFKTKDIRKRELFGTTAFSAFMGVTEPAIYGVFVPNRRPYLAVIIGGGLGGLVAGIMGVVSYAPVTLFGLATYLDGGQMNFISMVAAVLVGFVGAMIAAYILGIPNDKDSGEAGADKLPDEINEGDSCKTDVPTLAKAALVAPVTGDIVPLSGVSDQAFATGALGKGVGVDPKDSVVCAPASGVVTALFPTGHAFGITSNDGVETLVHIGIDTVELEGEGFKALVKQGDVVEAGDGVVSVDFDLIRGKGIDPTVMVVVSNSGDYLDVIPTDRSSLKSGDPCITVIA